jgi:glycosyltransferase involved in cell wall biosynthesis
VEPENPHDLVDKLRELKNNPQAAEIMGKKAREFTEANYSRQKQAEELMQILSEPAPLPPSRSRKRDKNI